VKKSNLKDMNTPKSGGFVVGFGSRNLGLKIGVGTIENDSTDSQAKLLSSCDMVQKCPFSSLWID
jgi:hypothetical protein